MGPETVPEVRDDPVAGVGGRRGRRLCLVTHAPYPIGEPRGERAANSAKRAGYDVTVIALRRAGEPAEEMVNGVEVQRLPISHARGAGPARMLYEYLAFTLMAIWRTLALHRRARLDVVEVHSPPDFLIVAGLLPRFMGSRLILDIRDIAPHMWDVRFAGKPGARLVEKVLIALERAACALAEEVITVHGPYRQELLEHGVPSQKVHVVMNPPDPAVLARAAERTPEASLTGFTVAYHGTITHWYGVDLMVEAVAEAMDAIPELQALVLGEGDALPQVRALADELGIAGRVSFSGEYRPIEETLSVVSQADCGVIPNRPSLLNRFALGNKLFEYVALGVPVVVADLETLRAHFSEEEVTFFEAGDARSLAKALVWVATHPDEARAKATRAAARAEAYSWERNSARYVELLDPPAAAAAA